VVRIPPFAAVVFAALLLASACGGGADGTADGGTPAPRRQSGDGALIITRLEGMYERDIASGDERVILAPGDAGSFFLDPAVSADGNRLAYVLQPPPKTVDGRYDAGSDLWVADRDGSNPRMIFRHTEPSQLARFPLWRDATHVLAIIQEISLEAGVTTVTYTLQDVDIETGERRRIVDDVLAFGVSPDGGRLAYAKLAPTVGETFEAVGLDGAGAVTLVGVKEGLAPFSYPRYSPDGATIAFASADVVGVRARASFVSTRLDGPPQDIWTIAADGGSPRRIADLKEDLPSLTWNGDGTHIYVIGVAGLYDVNLENGITERIGEGTFHGQIAWAP
jgi:hypothetical protein